MWETWDLWERAVMIEAFQVDQAWASRLISCWDGDGDHDFAKVVHDDFSELESWSLFSCLRDSTATLQPTA